MKASYATNRYCKELDPASILQFIESIIPADSVEPELIQRSAEDCAPMAAHSIIITSETFRERRSIATEVRANYRRFFPGRQIQVEGLENVFDAEPMVNAEPSIEEKILDKRSPVINDDGWLVLDLGSTFVHVMSSMAKHRLQLSQLNKSGAESVAGFIESTSKSAPRSKMGKAAFLERR